MGDYERRYRGGGGGRGGHNPRKRRYQDDEDTTDRYRGGGQRRRHEAPPFTRIRKQLLTLAESPLRGWHEEAMEIARLVVDNYDDEYARNGFLDLVPQLVVEQPLKTPFVAAVVLVINTLKPELVEQLLVSKLAPALERAISQGEWRDVKLLLKLLACMQSCLEGEGVFPVLDDIFSRAADLQIASSDDTVGTELVKIIMLTIPYVMAAVPGQWGQNAADLLEKTDIIAGEPHPMQKVIDPYVFEAEGEGPSTSTSRTELLQKQLLSEASNGWALDCIPRPWKMPLEEVEQQSRLDDCAKHALPAIAVPANVVTGSRPLFPEVHLSVYAGQGVESVPPESSIASSLIRDALVDTISILHYNRNATARFLIDIDCYFANGTFVKRATPFDRLREVEKGQSTWKPEDVIVDAVFSQLLQLPAPEHKLVYYHSVLIEACKLAPAAVAPSLGRAIRSLYRNNPRFDLELSHRFVDWFSHHLSNFGFTWKWTEWVDDVELPDSHPYKAFILAAIEKEIRLSFAQRIKNTLPDQYRHLIYAEQEEDVPKFKFLDDDVPFAAQGREIAELLKRKSPDVDFQPVLDKIQEEAVDSGRDPLISSTDVFMTALLAVGSKSLSHVLACIERVKDRLLDMGAASASARLQIIAAVMSYWSAHPGVALSIVEKLLNYSILTPETTVQWALGSPVGDGDNARLSHEYIYELVFNTIVKVTGRVRQVVVSGAHAAAIRAEGNHKDDVAMTDGAPQSLADNAEVKNMRALFGLLEESLSVRLASAHGETARRWAQRWLRTFRRRGAIEDAFLAEAEKKNAADEALPDASAAAEPNHRENGSGSGAA